MVYVWPSRPIQPAQRIITCDEHQQWFVQPKQARWDRIHQLLHPRSTPKTTTSSVESTAVVVKRPRAKAALKRRPATVWLTKTTQPRLNPIAALHLHCFSRRPELNPQRPTSALAHSFGDPSEEDNAVYRDIISPRRPLSCMPVKIPMNTVIMRRCQSASMLREPSAIEPKRISYWEPTSPNIGPVLNKCSGLAARITGLPKTSVTTTPGPGDFEVNYDAVTERVASVHLPFNESDDIASKRLPRARSAKCIVMYRPLSVRAASAKSRRSCLEAERLHRLSQLERRRALRLMNETRRAELHQRCTIWLTLIACIPRTLCMTKVLEEKRRMYQLLNLPFMIKRMIRKWIRRWQLAKLGPVLLPPPPEPTDEEKQAAIRLERVASLRVIINFLDQADQKSVLYGAVKNVISSTSRIQAWWRSVQRIRQARIDFITVLIGLRLEQMLTSRRVIPFKPSPKHRCRLLEHILTSIMIDRIYRIAQLNFKDVLDRREIGVAFEISPTGKLSRECWFRTPALKIVMEVHQMLITRRAARPIKLKRAKKMKMGPKGRRARSEDV